MRKLINKIPQNHRTELKNMAIGSTYGFFFFASYDFLFVNTDIVANIIGFISLCIMCWIVSVDFMKFFQEFFPISMKNFNVVDIEGYDTDEDIDKDKDEEED